MTDVPCKHWSGGACSLSLYGGRPSPGVCMKHCMDYDGPARGAGDLIAKVTKAVGVKPCGKCTGRQKRLNSTLPL